MPPRTFQSANRLRRLNRVAQATLALSLIFGLNHLAQRLALRWDLNASARTNLAPESIAFISEITTPLTIFAAIPANPSGFRDESLADFLEQLLINYRDAALKHAPVPINFVAVDVFKDLDVADRLARDFAFRQPFSILVTSPNRHKLLPPEALVQIENDTPVAFTAESAISSAILEVGTNRPTVAYFITGHGETHPDDTHPRNGLSRLAESLRQRNFTLRTLDLHGTTTIPDDADLLVLANPQGPLSPTNAATLRAFLNERAGRLLAWLDPNVIPGFDNLLNDWGIALPPSQIAEPDPAAREADGTLVLRNFAEHPVTQSLIENQTAVLASRARPVLPLKLHSPNLRVHATPILATSRTSTARPIDPLADATPLGGPIPIAIAAEQRSTSDLGINVNGGKWILLGAPDLFSNERIGTLGNLSLALNAVHWLTDRGALLNVPPKAVQSYQLSLSQQQARNTAIAFLAVPASFLLLGFIVFIVRRF